MDMIIQLMRDENRLPVLVYCGGGKGRAGTVVACYLAACGFKILNPYITQPEMAASEAVNVLRSIRPGSMFLNGVAPYGRDNLSSPNNHPSLPLVQWKLRVQFLQSLIF